MHTTIVKLNFFQYPSILQEMFPKARVLFTSLHAQNGQENEEPCPWNEFHVWLDERGREIVDIPRDGLCYFRALQNSLGVQYSQNYTLKEIEEKLIEEISQRPKFYLTFYPQVTKKERSATCCCTQILQGKILCL